jgi:hypothetical protein
VPPPAEGEAILTVEVWRYAPSCEAHGIGGASTTERGKAMKKNLKKLALHRETLRALEDGAMQEAVGGISVQSCGSPCSAACTVAPCHSPSDACSLAARCTK